MKKKVFLILLLVLLMPLCALAGRGPSYVQADRVHLRMKPSKDAKSLGLYFAGTEAEVQWEENDHWVCVRIGTETGYMMREFVSTETPADNTFVYRLTQSNGLYVNLREFPGMDAEVLTTCRIGQPVQVMGETSSGWSYVTANGKTGYILTDLLEDCPEASGNVLNTTPDGHIIMIVADNLQALYYVASEPLVRWIYDDVNFDGYADIVVHTAFGASNLRSEFFVYDAEEGRYARVDHGLEEGMYNYRLFHAYPDEKYVLSHLNSGNAGMLNEMHLFRWEDGEMRHIRAAYSREKTESELHGQTLTTTEHFDVYDMRVVDYLSGVPNGETIWQREVGQDDGSAALKDALEEEYAALWKGL